MNNIQAGKALDIVFSNMSKTFNNKTCVLIDGDWGIGKTHFIQDYFSKNINEYELIYTSVFGKNSVKDIEKSILIHLIPGLKKIKEDSCVAKLAKTLINDIGDKFLGVSIENYVNSFSIEDIKWDTIDNKHIIICFDDIERKSDTVEMKNLLGLIERASKNFDILIVGNSKEINESDIKIFDKYKEKVIDHVIKIDKIDRSTLKCILENIVMVNRDDIIEVYLSDNIAFGKAQVSEKSFLVKNINNLRVFTKYVELIMRLERHLELDKVDKDIQKICKAVIYDHYFVDKNGKKSSMNFDKFNIYKTVNNILLNEDIEKDEFKDYFIANSEVRKDIESIYNAYKLSEGEFEDLIKKLKIKIENNDLEYFIKQENVISLTSALREVKKIDKNLIKKLFEVAVELYSPEKYIRHTKIDHSEWNDYDEYGNEIECNKNIKAFIDKINEKCDEKYQTFISNKLESARSTKNYEEILTLFKFNEMNEIEDFKNIFNYYFDQLVVNYSKEVAEKISTLINKTNSDIISDFFSNRIKNETQITKIKKYELFDSELDRKMQYQAEYEYYRDNPPEEDE